jgi:FMN reductase
MFMNHWKPLVVGIGGSVRPGSTTENAVRIALAAAERAGADTEMITGPELDLPAYDPAVAERSKRAQRLVEMLRHADGIIIGTPGYHGSISGLVKNALDYIEDMREDPEPYLDGRPVGCIVAAYGAQAIGTTLIAVRSIVHSLRGWNTPYAAGFNSATHKIGPNGENTGADVIKQIELVAAQVQDFIRMRAAERPLHSEIMRDRHGAPAHRARA